jgi:tRNA A37 threonylcarbamoyladenosine modification protein TsaB
MQGLAFGQGKPLIGISGLTALRAVASPAFLGSRIAAWVDAWRGDVYAVLFEDGRQVGEPVVARPDDLLATLAGSDPGSGTQNSGLLANDITFIGDGAEMYRDLIVSRLGGAARIADPAAPLLAGVIAVLATIEFTNGHRPEPHAIRPLYVRRPDAELARDRGSQRVRAARSNPESRIPNPERRVPDPGQMNVVPAFRIELLEGEADLEGVLEVERESFTSPWTREMYAWELQNRAVCHIYIVARQTVSSPGSARSGSCSTRFTSTTSRCVRSIADTVTGPR